MEHTLLQDRKLPDLSLALNGEEMRIPLSEALRHHDGFACDLIRVEPRVLKHTPGKRCVIEYRLFTRAAPERPQRLIAKRYRKERGHAIFENLRSLWLAASLPGVSEPRLRMPEPMAYLPELKMILQRAAPGRQFSEFAAEEDLTDAVRRIAINLAGLHNLTVTRGERKTLPEHLEKYCRPGPQALSAACPQLEPLTTNLVERILADESLQRAPLVPAHGDLNLAQIFITNEAAYFIDFDGFCLTHAALDLGNFLVTLQTRFGEASMEMEKIFLKAYRVYAAAENLAGLRVYQAFAYLRRAMIAFRLQAEPDWQAHVRRLLEKGISMLKSEYAE